jgi:DNA-binding SARP family transcriptional activator
MADFSVLGPLRARRRGIQIALGTPQQRTVLAFLLVRHGEVVTAEELVRAVWDDHPPRAADGTIRTYVSRLRRALATVDIAHPAGGYSIRVPASDLDLAVFRDLVARAREDRRAGRGGDALAGLRAAAELWTGTPLAGMPGVHVQAQRARLERLKDAADRERQELAVELEPSGTDPGRPPQVRVAATQTAGRPEWTIAGAYPPPRVRPGVTGSR